MFYVPLYIEALRSRPNLLFWAAALTQAFIWLAVPMVFYAAPPGDLPQLLAIGHEFQLRGDVGPPLAYWLAEIAFRLAGLFGVYALAQICVVTTYWCVFALGSAIVGPAHAALAVLLMVGISLFTVPTPDFGPALLAMALWAVVLLHYWRAVGELQRRDHRQEHHRHREQQRKQQPPAQGRDLAPLAGRSLVGRSLRAGLLLRWRGQRGGSKEARGGCPRSGADACRCSLPWRGSRWPGGAATCRPSSLRRTGCSQRWRPLMPCNPGWARTCGRWR